MNQFSSLDAQNECDKLAMAQACEFPAEFEPIFVPIEQAAEMADLIFES